MDALGKRQALVLSPLNGDDLVEARLRGGREAGINVLKRFAFVVDAPGVDDTLPRLLAGGADRKGGDVVCETAGAAQPGLVVASDTGLGVEDRALPAPLGGRPSFPLPFLLQ